MPKGGADGKVSNGLVALSFSAVLAVYTAGYALTRDAAQRFETQSQERRPAARSERTTAVPPQAAPVDRGAAPHSRPEADVPNVRGVDASATPSATTERRPQEIDTPSAAPAPSPVETEPAAAAVAAAPAPTLAIVPTSAPAPAPEPPPPPAPKWKDGTYTGWGTSRHGDIEARVVIENGRIVQSAVSQCLTRYSCDVIDRIIQQPVQRQGPDVDFVSRATESADAYYFALVEALAKASPTP